MGAPIAIPVSDASRVAEVRRIVISLAAKEGLDENARSDAAIIATELATNLSKHSERGEMQISPLEGRGSPGIEMLAVDRGPGSANSQEWLVDGYSTSGTPGTGLGAIRRLASELDVYSLPGRGTVVSASIRGRDSTGEAAARMTIGAAGRPLAGEPVSGDAWRTRLIESSTFLLVADGLGHGASAAEASAEATRRFLSSTGSRPAEILSDIHRALRGTRGAAVSIAQVDFSKGKVVFSGLGNVAGVIVRTAGQSTPSLQSMVSQNGTAGHEARQFKEFEYLLNREDIIVMHSDGLSSHWNLQDSPGLLRRHPSVIAGTLYRDYARDRDDVCVVVGKKA